MTYCKHRIIGVSVIEKEAHDQPTQAYFFWILIIKEKEERNKACEKGIANEKNGQHFNRFFIPNPFGNWGSKGVIYFSFVKLLVKIQDQRWRGP